MRRQSLGCRSRFTTRSLSRTEIESWFIRETANGDVAPIRIIQGPDTQLRHAQSLAVDPINNILVIGTNRGEEEPENRSLDGALVIFNRTDNGNVKPRAIIRGPKSGIIRINQIQVYPQRKLIVAAMPGLIDQMEPENAFLGVWSYDDNGDVPLRGGRSRSVLVRRSRSLLESC